MEYVFYSQEQDSTFKMYEVEAPQARIRYTNEPPQCEVTLVKRAETFWNRFSLWRHPEEETFVFDVPRGSIKTDFTLDAK